MLDCSPAKIAEYRERYDFDFWQLRTPLTKYALAGVPYGLDNGCFRKFFKERWLRMLEEAEAIIWAGGDPPIFVTLPDIVGDAQRTSELFRVFKLRTNEFVRALVLQNGIEHVDIPWEDIGAVFIGGDDDFKVSPIAFRCARAAKMQGKWVHVGRVNTAKRMANWIVDPATGEPLADSIDGSGISQYDHMLEDVLALVRGEHPQSAMELTA